MIVEPRSGPELPSVGWSDRGLGVHTHVAAVEVGVGRRSGRARIGLRREVLVAARKLGQHTCLELETVVRAHGVVDLGARRPEAPILGDDIGIGVARERECRRITEPRRVRETAIAEERADEELRRLAELQVPRAELVAPSHVHKSVDVLLVIVDDPFH